MSNLISKKHLIRDINTKAMGMLTENGLTDADSEKAAEIFKKIINDVIPIDELIERGIPMIPKKKDNHGYYCPNCDNFYDGRSWKSKFCGQCGQELLWNNN